MTDMLDIKELGVDMYIQHNIHIVHLQYSGTLLAQTVSLLTHIATSKCLD